MVIFHSYVKLPEAQASSLPIDYDITYIDNIVT